MRSARPVRQVPSSSANRAGHRFTLSRLLALSLLLLPPLLRPLLPGLPLQLPPLLGPAAHAAVTGAPAAALITAGQRRRHHWVGRGRVGSERGHQCGGWRRTASGSGSGHRHRSTISTDTLSYAMTSAGSRASSRSTTNSCT
ncbi:hypothetical protein TSOC_008969 [Tetrabaena socialis]|uniref:Uncharacterized protein n=1 Tax=Tetrabaena socialis TaxID=47790 RepID=A0A2J7ZXB2_9CHLO|nr:hypothetical protein TSOC_008969 [Tetrabaena socialis]|eukprot:PNH04913.1 hypothetical protein TSOC_008969 [Tetrabaena socialis]